MPAAVLPPGCNTIALSGGVMQNDMLLGDINDALAAAKVEIWINQQVPANDGGLSLGQAAMAAFTSHA